MACDSYFRGSFTSSLNTTCSVPLILLRAVQTANATQERPQSSAVDISHHAHTACISIHNLSGEEATGERRKVRARDGDSTVEGYSLSLADAVNSLICAFRYLLAELYSLPDVLKGRPLRQPTEGFGIWERREKRGRKWDMGCGAPSRPRSPRSEEVINPPEILQDVVHVGVLGGKLVGGECG